MAAWYGEQDELNSHFILYVLNYTSQCQEKINYSSKHFIQNKPEVKNNLHSLFLQESPAKDSLLLFKFPKLTCRNNKQSSWLPAFSHALLFPCKRAYRFLFN